MNQRIVPDLFSIPIARWTSIAIASTLLGCGAPPRDSVEQSADALAALPDFGYGNMKTNGNIPEGHRPLFAIEVDDGANPGVLHTAAYYQSLLFGPGPSGFNANDYYLG